MTVPRQARLSLVRRTAPLCARICQIVLAASAALLAGQVAAAAPPQSEEAAYVVLGVEGIPTARVVTLADECPMLVVDGRALAMHVRAAPSVEKQRPTQSLAELSKASDFPVRVCDAAVPLNARRASISGKLLPLPHLPIRRIVVIGDTGCRLKSKDEAWQACNDPASYPFARIAARAAAWKPDAVIHVGDYLYRENPCAEGHPGCAGSPWGYGWDAWNADFFAPAKPLLEAAPWIVARGNHENCSRGGQGWWRLLDPRPLESARDCNDPANDAKGDYSPPYAVSLGERAQVVVMDLSHAGTTPYMSDDPRVAEYRDTWRKLARFGARASFTFAVDHYPIFGISAKEGPEGKGLDAGNQALQQLFAKLDPAIMPKGVDALLAGHIHLWEQVDFGGRQPSQFITGFSGTQEDIVPLPTDLPVGLSPAPDASVRQFHSIVDSFGFMTLERVSRTRWISDVYSVDGFQIVHCIIRERHSSCN